MKAGASSDPQNASTKGPDAAAGKDDDRPALVEGPHLGRRQALIERIRAAEKEGIGAAGYMAAFKSLEQMVKGGADDATVHSRIEAIHRGLDDQVKRAQILKTQRPAPPVNLSSGSAPGDDKGEIEKVLSDAKGGKPTGQILDKLREKFGDRIPAGIDADDLKKRIMEDERARELLKKLKN